MFNKLRNKLILINLGITSLVILATFSLIYILSTRSAETRPPFKRQDIEWRMERDSATEDDSEKINPFEFEDDVVRIVRESIEREKNAAAENLLVTLICSGIAIEVMVAVISFALAEQAIKPVRESYEAQKIFIANASHEIKTPLAAISANLEAADIKGNRWIKNIETETAKLTDLNGKLLAMARADLVTEAKTSETDLAKLTNSTIEDFESRLKKIKLTKKINAVNKAKFAAEDYRQILSILLDNAIKYADKRINLTVTDNQLTIENDGATIPEKDIPHIFERFYQVDKSAEGVGLGLSIAKSIADHNHWKLEAKSQNTTTFSLKF